MLKFGYPFIVEADPNRTKREMYGMLGGVLVVLGALFLLLSVMMGPGGNRALPFFFIMIIGGAALLRKARW